MLAFAIAVPDSDMAQNVKTFTDTAVEPETADVYTCPSAISETTIGWLEHDCQHPNCFYHGKRTANRSSDGAAMCIL